LAYFVCALEVQYHRLESFKAGDQSFRLLSGNQLLITQLSQTHGDNGFLEVIVIMYVHKLLKDLGCRASALPSETACVKNFSFWVALMKTD